MRQLLAATAAAVASAALAAMTAVEAKSIWIKCGGQEISLDSDKQLFSLATEEMIYQGGAVFTPHQIDFELIVRVLRLGNIVSVATKDTYAINRKTLGYERKIYSRTVEKRPAGNTEDSGWKLIPVLDNPELGKCSIMKTPPTAGNHI